MVDWLYIHIGLGHKGAFLFGFMTAIMIIMLFSGTIAMVWCKECLRVSESSAVDKNCKDECPEGINKAEEKPFSGMVQAVCLFRLLFVSMVWAGWMAVWFALLSAYYRFGAKGLFVVFMWAGLVCCGVALPVGVFAWMLTRSEAWKAEKEELYRAVDKSSK